MAHFKMNSMGVLVKATVEAGETSLTLPAGCTSVGSYAFRDCSGLTRVTLPVGCTYFLRNLAFYKCSGLTLVILVHPCDSPPVFVAWAVGASRSRTNWRLTPVHTSRNVVRLIVNYLSPRRESLTCRADLDRCPVFWNCDDDVFTGCTGLGFEEENLGR